MPISQNAVVIFNMPMPVFVVLCVLAVVFILIFAIAFCLYRLIFFASHKDDRFALPKGKQYVKYHDKIKEQTAEVLKLPYEKVQLISRDGVNLVAKYYHVKEGAPLEILMHGYKSTGEIDCGGGLIRCLKAGHNALLPDQRAQGESGGRSITLGVKERYDCADWVNYAVNRFGKDVRIILVGTSMGGATVLMTSDLDLPDNVAGIVSDSAFTSPKEIVKTVIKARRLPLWIVYPMIALGARVFGGFSLDGANAARAVCRSAIPLLLIHGEADSFVPCEMSKKIYESAAAEKAILTVPGAGHVLSFFVDGCAYISAVESFEKKLGL